MPCEAAVDQALLPGVNPTSREEGTAPKAALAQTPAAGLRVPRPPTLLTTNYKFGVPTTPSGSVTP